MTSEAAATSAIHDGNPPMVPSGNSQKMSGDYLWPVLGDYRGLHAPQTIASLHAGRHVLCEKPMAMNYEEALSMQRKADEVGRILGIAYYRRMYPKVIRALELIRLKTIGEPVFAEATSHYCFCPGPEDERSWFIDPAMAGGGPLYDIASHRIDLMNYLFGNPMRATAHLSNAVHQYAVEDNATVMVEYNSGVRCVVDVRWHSRILRDEFRIRGTDGEIEMTPLNSGVLIYPGGTEELPPHENLHYPCVADFVSAVLAGTELRSSGATALATAWVTDEAIRLSNGGLPDSGPAGCGVGHARRSGDGP